MSKWLLAFSWGFMPGLAIYMGLLLQNWIVFGTTLLVVPFLMELIFATHFPLKPVGIRTLREKIRGKIIQK
ncbi:hypothetical protein MO867_21360 [Microbulbifer sp. OS29]|uniref:Uncharacterized protein n=1 Tax=Microbulbifer okhotskensis TaxID=2926617 RepID=A0A9X2ESB1_9GAMM|nr:hypothetical protein [Microbulbifer okhotskensis]MCO1336880.1 hypothetical protein [Microbulbifer okhotskensis]